MLPPRSPNRKPLSSPYSATRWKDIIQHVTTPWVLLQLLFLGNTCYMYGAFFQADNRAHALKILAVDYDGAEIGEALKLAYESLEAKNFPTLEFRTPEDFPTPDLVEDAVCRGDYWAAIRTYSDASNRVIEAINGNNTTTYDPGDTISYTYLGVYYPAVAASVLDAKLKALANTASRSYYSVAHEARSAVDLTDPVASSVFFNPIQASSSIKAATNQGTRVLFNTVSMVMPQLVQFFFTMGLNAVFTFTGAFASMSKRDVYLVRLLLTKSFSLTSALGMAGYIWAFREDWTVSAGQFFSTWMCLWLLMDINYLVVDTFIEVVVPMRFWAYCLLSWIIAGVTSTVYPFELSPGFYRWGHALPAHNVWRLLMMIWPGGCRQNGLKVALPVLFAWWVAGNLSDAWSVRRRCMLNEKAAGMGIIETAEPSSS
ncbi:hypothetical protein QQX98_002812 [Neonectria punicea]|uniref:DUF3533 domain-containing protein n=1 Tax=Neonectria punicea TaxID=979145 RepID=A0ABR1HH94_9HYPO